MTISAPIPRPLPSRHWKKDSTVLFIAALDALPADHMLKVKEASDGYLHTVARRYGYRIATRKLGDGTFGVWRIAP